MAVARSGGDLSVYKNHIEDCSVWNSRESRVRTDRMICPIFTLATVPLGLPNAPRMPVCSLSAPAHDNILLMRTTW